MKRLPVILAVLAVVAPAAAAAKPAPEAPEGGIAACQGTPFGGTCGGPFQVNQEIELRAAWNTAASRHEPFVQYECRHEGALTQSGVTSSLAKGKAAPGAFTWVVEVQRPSTCLASLDVVTRRGVSAQELASVLYEVQ